MGTASTRGRSGLCEEAEEEEEDEEVVVDEEEDEEGISPVLVRFVRLDARASSYRACSRAKTHVTPCRSMSHKV